MEDENMSEQNKPASATDKQTLTVTVRLEERNQERSNVDLKRSDKVGEAATGIATQLPFNLPTAGSYTFRHADLTLDQKAPLAKYHQIKDGDTLYLVDLGGGV
jgi:hypothetical protein